MKVIRAMIAAQTAPAPVKRAPVISFVGRSNSGKTTLLERIIPELRGRGLRIATIKHDVHSYETDCPGKDTWKHARAGAEVVVLAAPDRLTSFRALDREWSLDEIASTISGVDLIITEGYKRADKPKIEVWRGDEEARPLCGPADRLIAIASDRPRPGFGVPWFDLGQPAALADFISQELSAGRL